MWCACACVWMNVKARGWHHLSFWITPHLTYWGRVFHLTAELTCRLYYQPACHEDPISTFWLVCYRQATTPTWDLHGCWGAKFQSSRLGGRHPYTWLFNEHFVFYAFEKKTNVNLIKIFILFFLFPVTLYFRWTIRGSHHSQVNFLYGHLKCCKMICPVKYY